MLIIFEGINGTGKSTCAQALSERLGAPVVRPFRHDDHSIHWGMGGQLETALRSFGVPLNTHVDDLYVADILSIFHPNAILDRSVPSGIAYSGALKQSQELFEFWCEQVASYRGPTLYVYMVASYDVSKQRCGADRMPSKGAWNDLKKSFDFMYAKYPHTKMTLDTTEICVEDCIGKVYRRWLLVARG